MSKIVDPKIGNKYENITYNRDKEIIKKMKAEKFSKKSSEVISSESKLLRELRNLNFYQEKKQEEARLYRQTMEEFQKNDTQDENFDIDQAIGE